MSAARTVTATFAKFRLTVATAGVGAGIVRGPGLTCVRPAVVGNECTETYAAGAIVRLTARAAAGSGFTGWGGACTGTADCVVTMSAARAVTATFAKFRLTVATAGVGAGIVGGPGLTCVRPAVVGNECTETYAAGAVVRLTARAAAGSGFTGWGGACAGAGTADCVVTMSAARAVTATFAKFRLTVATAGVGAGVVGGPGLTCVRPAVVGNECTETYAAGAVVRLTARAAAGSGFTGWGGACAGAGTADCVVTMSAARAVTATFAKFRLTVATAGVGAGVVGGPGLTCVRPAVVGNECTETYAAGAVVRLTARAAAGSGFTGWGGACKGAGTADCVVTMSAARAVTATFAKFRLTVATAGVGGGIVGGPGLTCVRPAVVGNECTETYAAGAVVTLTARAAAGSGFTGWGGACAGAGTADCVVTMSAARAVTATFAKFP